MRGLVRGQVGHVVVRRLDRGTSLGIDSRDDGSVRHLFNVALQKNFGRIFFNIANGSVDEGSRAGS